LIENWRAVGGRILLCYGGETDAPLVERSKIQPVDWSILASNHHLFVVAAKADGEISL
jgi:hypothetical protein